MTTIRQEDLIQSIADALQFISYYHPADYIQRPRRRLRRGGVPRRQGRHGPDPGQLADVRRGPPPHLPGHRHRRRLPQGRDGGALQGHRAQPPGLVDAGVHRAYTDPDNILRASMVSHPIGARKEHRRQHPGGGPRGASPGDRVEVRLAAKGGGSENKSRFAVLNPSDSLVDWVLRTVPTLGAGWCPPGDARDRDRRLREKAMLLAKEALIGRHRHPRAAPARALNPGEALRLELYEKRQCPRHRCPGAGGAHHGPGREDPRLPHPCRLPARSPHPQLCGHPARRTSP